MQSVYKLLTAGVLAGALVTPAGAAVHQFETFLDGAQAGTTSPGTGFGTLAYDDVSNLLSWNISFSGLLAPETVSHFHGPAAPGSNAGVQIGLPVGSPKIGSATLSETQELQLLDELWYINVHSSFATAGEIRGQLLLAPVPEPETYAMMLAGLGLVGAIARRRKAS